MVYKYYSPSDYNFDALEKQYFYFSRIKKLNDPFDCSFELISKFNLFIKRIGLRGFESKVSEEMKEFATCSFSKTGTNKNLWALYANNYTGFCVSYDDSKIHPIKTLEWNDNIPVLTDTSIENDNTPLAFTIKGTVLYTNDIRNFDDETSVGYTEKKEDCSIDKPIRGCLGDKYIDELYSQFYFIKNSESWKSEDEIRLFAGNYINKIQDSSIIKDKNGIKIPFTSDIVSSIIIGHNCSFDTLERILLILDKYPNSKVYTTQPGELWNIDLVVIDKKNIKDIIDKGRYCIDNPIQKVIDVQNVFRNPYLLFYSWEYFTVSKGENEYDFDIRREVSISNNTMYSCSLRNGIMYYGEVNSELIITPKSSASFHIELNGFKFPLIVTGRTRTPNGSPDPDVKMEVYYRTPNDDIEKFVVESGCDFVGTYFYYISLRSLCPSKEIFDIIYKFIRYKPVKEDFDLVNKIKAESGNEVFRRKVESIINKKQ